MLILILFWTAAAVVAYGYVGFPVLVLLRGRLVHRPYGAADIEPTVSVVIAAHNEAASIGARLDDLLRLDYPAGRLEVVIASDGSDDATNAIVRERGLDRVRLLELPRAGKIPALNAAAAAAGGEVLVFTDANTEFAPDAVRAIVRPFADPAVGGVAGDQRYLDAAGTGGGERSYWDLDRRLKEAESRAGSVISATGALYAIRRELYRPIPIGVTDDFAISTGVIAAGRRLVFAPEAAAFEPVASTGRLEFGRKVRIIGQGLRAVAFRRELLDPRRHGFYAVQLFSHKLLRRLLVFPLIAILLSSLLLWTAGPLYQLAVLGQAAFYGLGAAGLLLAERPLGRSKALSLPAFFCLVNAAALRASADVVLGRRVDRWTPVRSGGPSGDGRGTAGTDGQGEDR